MSIDWSMHDGYSYVTSPRNQLFTNFCWGFAVTALIESMVRREHGAWCARSEGDLFFGLRYFTFLGGDPNAASDFVYENGLADPDCVPWFGTEANFAHPESGSADRAGRVVRAPRIQEVNGINTQIHWLHTIGPLIGSFDVFDDFGAFYFLIIRDTHPASGQHPSGFWVAAEHADGHGERVAAAGQGPERGRVPAALRD